jgi:hypothetical protein
MGDLDNKKMDKDIQTIQKLTQALLRRIREEEAANSNKNLKPEFRDLISKEKF